MCFEKLHEHEAQGDENHIPPSLMLMQEFAEFVQKIFELFIHLDEIFELFIHLDEIFELFIHLDEIFESCFA